MFDGEETSLSGKFWVPKFPSGEVTGNHPWVPHRQYTTIDNIYYLKISIDNFVVMEVLDSQYNFSCIKPWPLFWEHTFFGQMEKKLEEKQYIQYKQTTTTRKFKIIYLIACHYYFRLKLIDLLNKFHLIFGP